MLLTCAKSCRTTSPIQAVNPDTSDKGFGVVGRKQEGTQFRSDFHPGRQQLDGNIVGLAITPVMTAISGMPPNGSGSLTFLSTGNMGTMPMSQVIVRTYT